MSLTTQDKADITLILETIIDAKVSPRFIKLEAKFTQGLTDLDTKLTGKIDRLANKVDAHQAVNIKHHLETRKAIGGLNQNYDNLKDGLKAAAA